MKLLEYIDERFAKGMVEEIIKTKKEVDKEFEEQWNVEDHKVNDTGYLKDKILKDASGVMSGIKKHNRISIPYQKLIVNNSVSFGFGNEVRIKTNAETDKEQELLTGVHRVLYENKEMTLNMKVAREVYSTTEVAELWYVKDTVGNDNYVFSSDYSIRSMVMSSKTKDTLYPIFDDKGDLIIMGRGYSVVNDQDKIIEAMTVWTSAVVMELRKETEWAVVDENVNDFGKIPVVYSSQDDVEWADVQSNIERLELLLSKHAEINDYHAAPKVFVAGELISMPQAGEAGGVLQGSEGTKVEILSWQNSTDSVKLEIDTLIMNIHKFTQTPDISFENVKGLNQASGVMLKMLFMDAHLKVMRKLEIWDAHFTRRYNLLKRMLNVLSFGRYDQEESMEMTPIITPFMVDDLQDMVDTLQMANGGKPLISHRKSIEMFAQSDDVDDEFEKIKEEEGELFDLTIAEPVGIL